MAAPLPFTVMRIESRIFAVILVLIVMFLPIVCLAIAWRANRIAWLEREHAFKAVDALRERPNDILLTSIERLAMMKSLCRNNSSIVDAGTLKLELVHSIWQCGAYESEINALGGPRAIDLAYLMLFELGCESPEHIQTFFEIAKNQLGKEAFTEEIEDVRGFVSRALAPRTAFNPIALE